MNVFTRRDVVAEIFSTVPSGGYFGAPGILLLGVRDRLRKRHYDDS